MKRIPLTQNQFALVDDADFEELSKHKWYATKTKYGGFTAVRNTKDKTKSRFMHRQIMNAPKGKEVDHINHDTLDNRRCNLRVCTRSENNRNSKKMKNTSSKYKGVSWYKTCKNWAAKIYINKKNLHIGYFSSEVEAAKAYDKKARDHFGTFANLNFPERVKRIPTE